MISHQIVLKKFLLLIRQILLSTSLYTFIGVKIYVRVEKTWNLSREIFDPDIFIVLSSIDRSIVNNVVLGNQSSFLD